MVAKKWFLCLKTSPRDFYFYFLNRIEELPLIIPNFKPERWTRPSSLNIGHEIFKFSPVIKRNATSGSILDFPACYVTCVWTWNMASEDDYLHLSCESSDSEEEKTLPENASKNMAYSRISLNHILRKTALLTIVVIRKRRRWTADIAVARTVSSGEYFCFLPSFFFFLLFSSFFTQGKISWDILNAILCSNIIPNHSDRVIYSEWRQHL